jgi:hypothetical protein
MGIISVSIMTAILGAAGLGAPETSSSQWGLRSIVPGGPLCRAEKFGDTIDTQLVRNLDGKPVLVAGHPDWDHKTGLIQVTISVDDGPPVSLEAYVVGPTVWVAVEDDILTAQLKTAHEVT